MLKLSAALLIPSLLPSLVSAQYYDYGPKTSASPAAAQNYDYGPKSSASIAVAHDYDYGPKSSASIAVAHDYDYGPKSSAALTAAQSYYNGPKSSASFTPVQNYGYGPKSSASLAAAPSYGTGSGVLPASSSPTAPSNPSNPTIKVSDSFNTRVFTPPSISAPVGATVVFTFEAGNHSIVQSSFSQPCEPLSDKAITSGFLPPGKTFTIKINDTNPIWYYCSQTAGNHCQNGMVGVINPPGGGGQTLQAFRARASMAGVSKTLPMGVVQGGEVGEDERGGMNACKSGAEREAMGGAAGRIAMAALVGTVLFEML